MNLAPLVSIVVPIYNMATYLPRCLDSLCGQTLKDIEIICIDDGSTDESPAILRKYAENDGRIIIISQPNQGVASARNKGLSAISGSFMASVDPDDWLSPEACERAVNLFLNDQELDFVSWSSRIIYDKGARPPEASTFESLYQVMYKGKKSVDGETILNSTPNVCNQMFKVELIRKFHINFPSNPVGEDGAFWYKFVAHAHFGYYLDECFYNYYRGRADSATSGRKIPQFNGLAIFNDVYKHYLRHELLSDENKKLLAQIFINMYRADLHSSEDRGAVRKKAGDLARNLDLQNLENNIIEYLKAGRDHELAGYSFMEKLFSLKNRDENKVLTILGMEVMKIPKSRKRRNDAFQLSINK